MFCNLSRSHLRRQQSKLKQPDVLHLLQLFCRNFIELYILTAPYFLYAEYDKIRVNTELPFHCSCTVVVFVNHCQPNWKKKLFSSNLWHYWECVQACPCAAFVFFTFAHYLVIWFPSAPSLEQQNRGLRMSINWALFPPCLHLIE